MAYTRPAHGDPGNDGSATDATVIIDALADGLEAAESTLATVSGNYLKKTITGTTGVVTREISVPGTTETKWRELFATGAFNGHNDPVWYLGWNPEKATGGGDAAAPALFMAFEADYYDTASTRTMEWYVEVMRADSSGLAFRPFMFTAARDSNADLAATVSVNMGDNSNGSSRSKFLIAAGAATVAYFTPTGAFIWRAVNLTGTVGVPGSTTFTMGNNQNTGDTVIYLNPYTGSQAGIQWKNAGTSTWYLYDAASTVLYLRDNANAKMHVTYTRGAGAGGGTTEFNTAVKIVGNVGFYNTAPAAKPTVSGAKGSNAALGSLLTALSGLGLITDSSTA